MKEFLKLLAVLVLPVWLLDGCINRDPLYYLDSKSQLGASWPGGPLYFDYRDRTSLQNYAQGYQLDNITEFLMDDSVFTGMTGNQYFIIRRADGYKVLFDTKAERDAVLAKDYSVNISNLHEKPWYSEIQAGAFFPYDLLYYGSVTILSALYCWIRHHRTLKSNTRIQATEPETGARL